MLPKGEKGFLIVALALLLLLIVIIGAFVVTVKNIKKPFNISSINQVVKLNSTPKPTSSSWKSYKNSEFGFEVTYPSYGVIAQKDSLVEGVCGNAIKVEAQDKATISVDNFFKIKVIPWNSTVTDYMISQGAGNVYNTASVSASLADEAIELKDLRAGVEYARGYPPLIYVIGLFKKGNSLFVMQTFQNPTNFGGCILPKTVDPAKYPQIFQNNWNPTQSLKFTP